MTQLPETVSALMPVHGGIAASHLREALESLVAQTRPVDELVIVVDGPVTTDHEHVLSRHPGAIVLRSRQQRGAGRALATGLAACSGTLVARADSDDINLPDRVERQVAALVEAGADVCSSAMEEFETHPPRVVGVRRTAIDHADFARLMATRNPVNHPTVMFRRGLAVDVGGYADVPYLEDYDLWARMLVHGARFVGVPDPLVRFRVDGMHGRRTAQVVDRSELLLQQRLVDYGLIGRRRMWVNLVVRGCYRRLPEPVLERVYSRLFRQSSPSENADSRSWRE